MSPNTKSFAHLRLSILFVVVALLAYWGLNAFIYYPASQILATFSVSTPWFFWIFSAVAILFPLGRFLEQYFYAKWVRNILWLGSFWLGMLGYMFLGTLLAKILLFVFANYSLGLLQQFTEVIHWYALVVFITAFVLCSIGAKIALHPKVRKLEYTFPKKGGKGGEFHIIAATDIHLGNLIGKKRFDKLVDQINRHHPDLVLFVGDTIDEDIAPVIHEDIGTSIRRIQTKLGVYAVNGNHEFMGGVEQADEYLKEHGVKLLRDQSEVMSDVFVLVGREDISGQHMGAIGPRKSLSTLIDEAGESLPIILMDHQPGAIRETVKDGRVALQLSGHTHHGQMWPLSIATRIAFEISWGAKKIGNTEFYVSSGWGTWGPPMRLGNTPELLDIRLKFE